MELSKTSAAAVRRRCRIKGEKFCQVCGDKALAHHFGALACETCKAFFRRNALRRNEVKMCSEERRCQINRSNRRQCPWCRLKKCFDVGMKADLIFDDDQKKELAEKVKRNKMQQSKPCSSTGTGLPQEQASPPFVSSSAIPMTVSSSLNESYVERGGSGCSSPEGVDSTLPHDYSVSSHSPVEGGASCSMVPGRLSHLEQSPMNATHTALTTGPAKEPYKSFDRGYAEDMVKSPGPHHLPSQGGSSCGSHFFCSPDKECFFVEQRRGTLTDLRTLTRDQLPSDPHMYWRLTEDERMLLTLMSAAYEDTVLASLRGRQTNTVLDSSSYTATDFLADCDMQVRNSVAFVKRLEDFRRLNLDDQIACFKSSVGSVLAVRNTYTFVAERNTWLMMKGQMTVELYQRIFPHNPYMAWAQEMYRELKAVIKNDITIYALLHCILLFSPSCEKVSDRQLVSTMRDKYVVLLRHYLAATFSYVFVEDYVRVLQSTMLEFCEYKRLVSKLAKDMNYLENVDFVRFELLMELHNEMDN